MEVEEASRVPGEALHLTVEGREVRGLSSEEVLLQVQEVGQVPGGQATEEDHQEPVDRALQVLPVLWAGEEFRAPQQHHLRGGRKKVWDRALPTKAMPAHPEGHRATTRGAELPKRTSRPQQPRAAQAPGAAALAAAGVADAPPTLSFEPLLHSPMSPRLGCKACPSSTAAPKQEAQAFCQHQAIVKNPACGFRQLLARQVNPQQLPRQLLQHCAGKWQMAQHQCLLATWHNGQCALVG